MIKVLFVNPAADLSGPENVMLRLMRGLDRRDFSFTVVCPKSGRLSDAVLSAGFPVRFLPLTSTRFSANAASEVYCCLRGAAALIRVIRSGRHQVVHVNSHRVGLPAWIAARAVGARILWHIHEIYQTSRTKGAMITSLARWCPDDLVAVSDAVAEQFHPCEKLHRIYNGIDTQAFSQRHSRPATRAQLGIGERDLVVGCMGRLSKQKGQDVFLRAAAVIVQSEPRARFLVAGDESLGDRGFGEDLGRLASALGIRDRVVFTGFRKDAADVMEAMDVLAHPAIIPDSLPNVILEAMSLGKPVVATRTGGSPELVVDDENGYLVTPGDPAALAQGISVLLSDAPLRLRFGASGRERINRQFNLTRQLDAFAELYRGLAKR